MIELEERYLDEIRNILKKKIPELEVWVFGSRVNGNPAKYSDLDLVIHSDKKIDWRLFENLKDNFSESDIPIKVDVLDWHSISENFRQIIKQNYEILQDGLVGKGSQS